MIKSSKLILVFLILFLFNNNKVISSFSLEKCNKAERFLLEETYGCNCNGGFIDLEPLDEIDKCCQLRKRNQLPLFINHICTKDNLPKLYFGKYSCETDTMRAALIQKVNVKLDYVIF
ncbi:hypothetical protein ACQ4LE_002831 [Meloidogyne hapla]